MSSWQPGQPLDRGRYILEKQLGEGGFGITYLVKDKAGNPFVIKTLNQRVQNQPDFQRLKEYFYNEALALARCSNTSPYIVSIIKVIDEQQLPCIVMEYIDGETLDKNVENYALNQRFMPESEALKYIKEIGNALTVVHNRKLLHRDVKPKNIIIRKDGGNAVLIDFGISRYFTPDEPGELTSIASEGYTPIEQYDRNGQHGYHSDVYSLAATLYFMLTTIKPIAARKRNSTEDPLVAPKTHNPRLSEQVNQAIMKGMERKPENRPQTVQEWLDLLPEAQDLTDTLDGKIKIPKKVIDKDDSDKNTKTGNILELLARAALMGTVFFLVVLCLLKLRVSIQPQYVVSLITCVGFLFIGQYIPSSEPKINLFISAIVPTLLILLGIFLKIIPGVDISSLSMSPIITLLTIGAGVLAFTLMAILKSLR